MPGPRLGEVVESSTIRFMAEADELHRAPAFGSLVCVCEPGRPTTMAVTYDVTTCSLDPGRRALARGQPPDRYDERIYEEFPELRQTLRTQFTAVVVGYGDRDAYWHRLPPYPARLHYSVCACTPDEQSAFTSRFDFLRTISQTSEMPADEVLAAVLRSAATLRDGSASAYLLRAGQALAALYKDDYDRLVTLLRRIAPAEEAAR